MCRLLLIRHGETDWNLEKRYQGHVDIPLNKNGQSQAHRLALKLKDAPLRGIYSSTLSRAHKTAKIIASHHNLPVETQSTLIEGHFGEFEGKLFAEIREKHHDRFETLKKLPLEEKLHYKLNKTQESYQEVLDRVVPTLKTLGKRHQDEMIVIVTHGGVIRPLITLLAKNDHTLAPIENGQALHFIYKNEELFYEDR